MTGFSSDLCFPERQTLKLSYFCDAEKIVSWAGVDEEVNMPDEKQIEEWRKEAKEQGPGIHQYVCRDLTPVYFRVDSKGRVRRLEGEVPWTGTIVDLFAYPGMKLPKFPLTYRHGYERAVAAEYEMLMNDLVSLTRWSSWRDVVQSQVDGLAVPYAPCDCYECWVRHCEEIATEARDKRPLMVAAIDPVAQRHALDMVPWGIGWLTQQFCLEQSDVQPGPEHTPKGYPRGQQDPGRDSLLLYVYLTGHMEDPVAREIIKPVVDLNHLADPKRQVQHIKSALGISRKPGRPAGLGVRDVRADDEVYELLRSQVRHLT